MPAPRPSSDLAFSDSVKAVQSARGSRRIYSALEAKGGWPSRLSEELKAFIADRRSFYLASANAEGQPYIQHRGGPKGFLHVLDDETLAFADFSGNRQYISTGNLADNSKVHLFLMDYAEQRRLKIWGEASVVEGLPDKYAFLMQEGYRARPERVFVIRVKAWDLNCPSHIPHLIEAEEVEALLVQQVQEIERLTARVRELEKRGA
jgi:uncharacterized protein